MHPMAGRRLVARAHSRSVGNRAERSRRAWRPARRRPPPSAWRCPSRSTPMAHGDGIREGAPATAHRRWPPVLMKDAGGLLMNNANRPRRQVSPRCPGGGLLDEQCALPRRKGPAALREGARPGQDGWTSGRSRVQRWPSSSSQLGAGAGCGSGRAFREQQGPPAVVWTGWRRWDAWLVRPGRVVGRGGEMVVVMGNLAKGIWIAHGRQSCRPCGHDGCRPQMDLWVGGPSWPSLGSAGTFRALTPEA